MDFGILLVIVGGWLDSVYTWRWEFPGLVYGRYSFFARSNVISKTSVVVMWACTVMFSPS